MERKQTKLKRFIVILIAKLISKEAKKKSLLKSQPEKCYASILQYGDNWHNSNMLPRCNSKFKLFQFLTSHKREVFSLKLLPKSQFQMFATLTFDPAISFFFLCLLKNLKKNETKIKFCANIFGCMK